MASPVRPVRLDLAFRVLIHDGPSMIRPTRPNRGSILPLAVLAAVSMGEAAVVVPHAQAAVVAVPRQRAVRPAPRRPVHHHHRTVVVAPVRPVPAVRPWYWGRVVAGVTIGTVIAVAAVNSVPKAPSPELCWFWTDSSKTRGYWNYCVAPKQP